MKLEWMLGFSLLILAFAGSSFAQKTGDKSTGAVVINEIAVSVEGGKTLRVKAADLAKLTRKEVTAKDHDGVDAAFSGFELREVLAPAGAKFGKELKGPMIGQYLIVEAADGYHAVYSLTDLDPDFADKVVILADTKNGKPLDDKNGPWQVIATNEKKHSRWVRQVTALKVRTAK